MVIFSHVNRTCSSTKTEICKYFESATGCVRGSKCFYAHAGAELRQMKQTRDMIHSLATWDLERKIFVGGLPPSMNSGKKNITIVLSYIHNHAILR